MTEDKAKKLVLEDLNFTKNEELPLVWVGDIIEENDNFYIIEGCNYSDGENPRDYALPYKVNKKTGDARLDVILE